MYFNKSKKSTSTNREHPNKRKKLSIYSRIPLHMTKTNIVGNFYSHSSIQFSSVQISIPDSQPLHRVFQK